MKYNIIEGTKTLQDCVVLAFNAPYELMEISPLCFFDQMSYVRIYMGVLEESREQSFSSRHDEIYDFESRLDEITSPYDLTFYARKLTGILYDELSESERSKAFGELTDDKLKHPEFFIYILSAFCNVISEIYPGLSAFCSDKCLWKLTLDHMQDYNLYFRTEEDMNKLIDDFNLDSFAVFSRSDPNSKWIFDYEI